MEGNEKVNEQDDAPKVGIPEEEGDNHPKRADIKTSSIGASGVLDDDMNLESSETDA